MKFGRLWFDGVVTDHDVSTDGELIWHVVVDVGDECDLNEVELTAVMLPLSASGTSPPDLAPTAGARLRHRSRLPPAALSTGTAASHPPPPLTTSVGTAGAPLALPPPIRPSPASFFTPQVEPDPPQTIAHRTRSSHQAAAALTTTQSPQTLAPSSPTSVLPFVERGGRYEGGLTPPIVDSPQPCLFFPSGRARPSANHHPPHSLLASGSTAHLRSTAHPCSQWGEVRGDLNVSSRRFPPHKSPRGGRPVCLTPPGPTIATPSNPWGEKGWYPPLYPPHLLISCLAFSAACCTAFSFYGITP